MDVQSSDLALHWLQNYFKFSSGYPKIDNEQFQKMKSGLVYERNSEGYGFEARVLRMSPLLVDTLFC